MSRITLRERFFPLHTPDHVDRFLERFAWSAVFKAGTSDKTVEAWLVVQHALEPRVDVAVGFIRLPEDRPASDRMSAVTGIAHRSPQLLLFQHANVVAHLDEFAIVARPAGAAASPAASGRTRARCSQRCRRDA